MSLVVRLSPRKLVTVVPSYGRKSVEAILLVDAATDDDDDANVGVEAGESVEREASSVKVEVTNELGPGVRAHITNSHSHRSVRSAELHHLMLRARVRLQYLKEIYHTVNRLRSFPSPSYTVTRSLGHSVI